MVVGEDIPVRAVADIDDGTLAPGTVLSQRKFCALYGCGREVARRVLRDLLSEGYLDHLAGSPEGSYVVAAVTEDTAIQGLKIRAQLEGFAAKELIGLANARLIKMLRWINVDLIAYAQKGDLKNAILMNRQFHLCFTDAVDLGPLSLQLSALYREASSGRFETYASLDEAFAASDDHTAIIDALEEGNRGRLITLVETHILAKNKHRVEGPGLDAVACMRVYLLCQKTGNPCGAMPRAGESFSAETSV